MAEKLALQQRIHERRTIADRQTMIAHRAELVDGERHKLFSDAGLAAQQDVGVMPRDLSRLVKDLQHRRTLPDDAVKFEVLQELLFQLANAFSLGENLRQFVQGTLQPDPFDRFGKVIVGTVFDGFNGRIQGVVAGHQYDLHARVYLESLVEESHAIHAGHPQVADGHATIAQTHMLQHLFRMGGTEHRIAHAFDHLLQHVHHVLVIVQNEGGEAVPAGARLLGPGCGGVHAEFSGKAHAT